MSQQSSRVLANEVSAKHVRINARYLMDFFQALYNSEKFLSMNNKQRVRNFCQALKGAQNICRRFANSQKKTLLVPKVRTVISPKPSQLEKADVTTNAFDDSFVDLISDVEESYFERSNNRTQIERPPRRPQEESPKTPEQTFATPISAQYAPVRPATSEKKQSEGGTPVRRPETRARRGDRFALPAMGIQSPKRRFPASTPNRTLTPKSAAPTFQVIIPSPNESGIEKIQCDRNMSNEEIDKINEIVASVSINDDRPSLFESSSISVTTRNVVIAPGKYQLYKVMRM